MDAESEKWMMPILHDAYMRIMCSEPQRAIGPRLIVTYASYTSANDYCCWIIICRHLRLRASAVPVFYCTDWTREMCTKHLEADCFHQSRQKSKNVYSWQQRNRTVHDVMCTRDRKHSARTILNYLPVDFTLAPTRPWPPMVTAECHTGRRYDHWSLHLSQHWTKRWCDCNQSHSELWDTVAQSTMGTCQGCELVTLLLYESMTTTERIRYEEKNMKRKCRPCMFTVRTKIVLTSCRLYFSADT